METGLSLLKSIATNSEEEQEQIESIYVIMKEFGYTLDYIKQMPIPHFNFLIKLLDKQYKKERAAMR